MKIRRFNESVVDEDILREICYDITDNKEFFITIDPWENYTQYKIAIRSTDVLHTERTGQSWLVTTEMEEVLLRLEDYLGEKHIKTAIYTDKFIWLDTKRTKLKPNTKVLAIYIIYK